MRIHELKSALFLAWRYFFTRKSTNAVHVIAIVSVIGIALVSLAMVVVLSVFNGFERFTTTQFSSLSPEYIIRRVDGKVFKSSTLDIPNASGVLTEQALASYEGNRHTVKVMGIESSYSANVPLDKFIFDGEFDVGNGENPLAVLGIGVAMELGTGVSYRSPTTITIPKRIGRVSKVMPTKNFLSKELTISGTLKLDQPEDNTIVFLPIETVRELLQYKSDEVSYLALGASVSASEAAKLTKSLSKEYELLDRYEQHPEVYRVLRVEKWVSFLLLFFVLLLSLFSVISTLGMLVLEKREDTATLRFMGAREKLIDSVIVIEGWLLSFTGLVIGLSLGVILVLLQERYGFVKFTGGDSGAFLIDAYPVELRITELFWIAAIILLVGWLSSRIAYRLFRATK